MEFSPELTKLIKDYQVIANAPFAQKNTSKFITDYLDLHHIDYTKSNYGIFIHKKGSTANTQKLILMCHTDHPGIVLKNATEGVFFGSPHLERFVGKSQKIRIFNEEGLYVGSGYITGITDLYTQRVGIFADCPVKKNYIAHLDIKPFEEDVDKMYLYNADDGINVSLLLYMVTQPYDSDLDLFFCFMIHEEVHQISSWKIASTNQLNITDEDFIVNLECLKIENILDGKYSCANYENGLVLQLSNTGCLFGYKDNRPNLSESLIGLAGLRACVPLQIGVIKDSCDSRPFSFFNLTPNICTITIPNRYKHNESNSGAVICEEIYKRDVYHMINLLEQLLHIKKVDLDDLSSEDIFSTKLKKHDDVTDKSLMYSKYVLNSRLNISTYPVVMRGYYYPKNLSDLIADFLFKALSYVVYFYIKLFPQAKYQN